MAVDLRIVRAHASQRFSAVFCSFGIGVVRSEIASPLPIASSIAMVASETIH